MANWITHILLAENLLAKGLPLDKRGFCIGSIAPDCNVENADWSDFIPPREVTHWMTGSSKQTADYEAFYREYISGHSFQSFEESSFLWGYYCHLVTDVLYQQFVRDPERVSSCYRRLMKNSSFSAQLSGFPETFDTLKTLFGKKRVFRDITILENNIVFDNPDCAYHQVLRKTSFFPDYLPFLPSGAIIRKIPHMTYAIEKRIPEDDLYFFTREEYRKFLLNTTAKLRELLKKKGV